MHVRRDENASIGRSQAETYIQWACEKRRIILRSYLFMSRCWILIAWYHNYNLRISEILHSMRFFNVRFRLSTVNRWKNVCYVGKLGRKKNDFYLTIVNWQTSHIQPSHQTVLKFKIKSLDPLKMCKKSLRERGKNLDSELLFSPRYI